MELSKIKLNDEQYINFKDEQARNTLEKINSHVIDIKLLGAKGDGATDDTEIIKNVCAVENATIMIPEGTYMVSSFIPLAKNVKIIGNNATIKTNLTNINIFGVNHYNDISGLKFELPYGFSGNVFEISYATLDNDSTINHDLNIHINKISFFFDPAINDLDYKKGSAFLIYADSTIGNNKFQSSGFFGIYIKDIFVKGACESVIKQYVNKTAGDWITGCYYENFNINSAPFFGFLGFRDINNPDANYTDGEMIYFNNWQMQCGNSKNMFAFSYGNKTLYNCMPWDWSYAVDNDKPFAVLYRESFGNPIFVDRTVLNVYDSVKILNLPESENFYKKVLSMCSGFNLLYIPKTTEEYKGKMLRLSKTETQTIEANKETEVSFDYHVFESYALTKEGNGIRVGEGVSKILVNLKLNTYNTGGISLRLYKNGSQLLEKSFADMSYFEHTDILNVTEGDIITVRVQFVNQTVITGFDSNICELFNSFKAIVLA